MKLVLAGAGAFGPKYPDAIRQIGEVDVVSLVGRDLETTSLLPDRSLHFVASLTRRAD